MTTSDPHHDADADADPDLTTTAGATTATITDPGPELSGAGIVAVLCGAALAPIDLFVVNVALASIGSDLRASAAALEWVVAAYGLGFAVLLVVGGRLGDAFGRRRLFVMGLGGFTVTSLICGLAPNAAVLVIARAAQGACAAMLVPQALSLIHAATTGRRRARAIGYYGATGGISIVIGQLAGGLVVSADVAGTSWRPIFLVNVPIGIVAVLLCLRTVPESRSLRPARVDGRGTVLLGVVLLLLLVPLMEGAPLGWPVWCWLVLALSPVALVVFVRVEASQERHGRTPLLSPSLLRLSSVRHGLGVAALFFVVFGGFLFVHALVLQDDLHLTPLTSGVALTPLGGAFLVLALLADRLVTWLGRRVITVGGLLTATGLVVLALTMLTSWPDVGVGGLVPGTLILGIGFGSISPTLFRIVLSQVPVETAGAGSGVLTTTQQVSTALGVATLGTLYTALRPEDAAGARVALLVVLSVEVLLAVGLALLATFLPVPTRGDRPRSSSDRSPSSAGMMGRCRWRTSAPRSTGSTTRS